MERVNNSNQPAEVYDVKPKTNGTLKLGRSPRNVEMYRQRQAAKLASRGSLDFTEKNQTQKRGR